MWHTIYKDWLELLNKLNKCLVEKETVTEPTPVVKQDSVKPVGRDLLEEQVKATSLYSIKDNVVDKSIAQPHLMSDMLSKMVRDVFFHLTDSFKQYFGGSKVGKLSYNPCIIFLIIINFLFIKINYFLIN